MKEHKILNYFYINRGESQQMAVCPLIVPVFLKTIFTILLLERFLSYNLITYVS